MAEKKATRITYPLITMFIGLISFSISSLLTAFLNISTNEGIIPIIGIPMGSLLMSLMFRKLNKSKVLGVIIRSELGGLLAFFIGLVAGYLFNRFFNLFIYFQDKSTILSKVVLCIAANASFGAFLAGYYFGEKAIHFFIIICGLVSIPFGILIIMPIHVSLFGTDLKLILFLISLGTSTGLSYGLYSFSC